MERLRLVKVLKKTPLVKWLRPQSKQVNLTSQQPVQSRVQQQQLKDLAQVHLTRTWPRIWLQKRMVVLIQIQWQLKETKWSLKSKWRNREWLRSKERSKLVAKASSNTYLRKAMRYQEDHMLSSFKEKLKSNQSGMLRGHSSTHPKDSVPFRMMGNLYTKTSQHLIQLICQLKIIRSILWIRCLRKRMETECGSLGLTT